jgi:hypothetical protein
MAVEAGMQWNGAAVDRDHERPISAESPAINPAGEEKDGKQPRFELPEQPTDMGEPNYDVASGGSDPSLGGEGLDPISVAPKPEAAPISTRGNGWRSPPSEEVSNARAAKMHFAMGDDSPGMDTIMNSIMSGREEDLRKDMATKEAVKWEGQRNKIIAQIAQKQGGAVDRDTLEIIRGMNAADFSQDPQKVFEQRFAEKYLNRHVADHHFPTGIYNQLSPGTRDEILTGHQKILAENEMWKTWFENTKSEYEKQNGVLDWLGWGQDIVMDAIPFYYAVTMANQTKGSPASVFSLTGKNLAEQVSYIRALPFEQGMALAKQTYEDIYKRSGTQAMHFARALMSYGYSDQFLDSAIAVADLSLIPAGKIASAAASKFIKPGAPRNLPLPSLNEMRDVKPMQGPRRPVTPNPDDEIELPAFYPAGKTPATATPRTPDEIVADLTADGTLSAAPWNEIRQAVRGEAQPPMKGLPESTKATLYEFRNEDTADLTSLLAERKKNISDAASQFAERQKGLNPQQRREAKPAFDAEIAGLKKEIAELERALDARKQQAVFEKKLFDRRSQAEKDAEGAMKDAIQATASSKLNPAAMMSQTGDIQQASIFGGLRRFGALSTDRDGVAILSEELGTMWNPWNFFGTGVAMANRLTTKVVDEAARVSEVLMDALGQAGRVTRLTPEAQLAALQEAQARLNTRYAATVNHSFIDMVYIPKEANPANVDAVVMRIGRPNALPFTSRDEAIFWAENMYGLTKGEYEVYRNGATFYVGIGADFNETAAKTWAAQAAASNANDGNLITRMLGRYTPATSEDVLAKSHSAQRKVAQHSQNVLRQALTEAMKPLKRLSRQENKEVNDLLIANRDGPAQRPGQDRGSWYDTVADFENAFFTKYKKLPTDNQSLAYYTYRQLHDFDYLEANLSAYRDKSRQGIEQVAFRIGDEEMPYFEAAPRDFIPWQSPSEFKLAVLHEGSGRFSVGTKSEAVTEPSSSVSKANVDALLKEGYQIFQVAEPAKSPLKKYGDDLEDVNFVVAKGHSRKPLSYHQVEYNPGVHSVYPYQWYVKQPIFGVGFRGKDYYYGDHSVMNFATEAEAIKYAARMDEARQMLKAGDAGLDNFLAKNLPYTRAQFEDLFKTRLSLNHPIKHSEAGTDVFRTDADLVATYPNAVSYKANEFDLSNQINRGFLTERDNVLQTVTERGSVLQIENAKQLDPYAALEAAANQRMRNMWVNDYKHMAVQQWIEQHKSVLDASEAELRANPYAHFYNPTYKNVGGTDLRNQLSVARASHRAIANFVGIETEIGQAITGMQNRIMNSIYGHLGQRAGHFVSDNMLPFIRDPGVYLRSVAFHTKLGFFNPVQLVLQAQSANHIIAVAGVQHGWAGIQAAYWMRALRHTADDAIIGSAANKAAKTWSPGKSGWKADEFREMYDAFRRSGLYEVMGEHAMRMDMYDQKLFRSAWGSFRDKGAMFFNEGERFVRLAAFGAAYKEWRAANLGKKIGDRELSEIMQRADLLSVNMTRASTAAWQQSALAFPMQFTTFHIRMAEQFMGKRLTMGEKAHAMVWYSMMYGIPSGFALGGIPSAITAFGAGMEKGEGVLKSAGQAAAGAIGMWPVYDDIRAAFLKRGYTLDSKAEQALHNGLISLMVSAITGEEYNVPGRFAPGGHQMIRDILRGDEGFFSTMAGASGSVIGDLIAAADPLLRRTIGAVMGGDDAMAPTAHDAARALRNVATADLAVKAYGVWNYGKIYTKGGRERHDSTAPRIDAVMAAMGLTPQQAADLDVMRGALKDQKQVQKKYEDAAMEEYRLATQYAQQDDWEKYDIHMKNMAALIKLGDFNPEDQSRILKGAIRSAMPMADSIKSQFIRRSPDSQYLDRFKAFMTK